MTLNPNSHARIILGTKNYCIHVYAFFAILCVACQKHISWIIIFSHTLIFYRAIIQILGRLIIPSIRFVGITCSVFVSRTFQTSKTIMSPNTPKMCTRKIPNHIDGLVQDCNISIASALEILQSCTNLSIFLCYLLSIEALLLKCLHNICPINQLNQSKRFITYTIFSNIQNNNTTNAELCAPKTPQIPSRWEKNIKDDFLSFTWNVDTTKNSQRMPVIYDRRYAL